MRFDWLVHVNSYVEHRYRTYWTGMIQSAHCDLLVATWRFVATDDEWDAFVRLRLLVRAYHAEHAPHAISIFLTEW